MPLSHSQARPCQLGVQGLASPSCQILGLLVSSQAVNRAHSLWAGVGWPQDVTVPMSQPWGCPTWALSSSRVQNSSPKGKKQNDGEKSVIPPNCFGPFTSQPRTSPFPAGSAEIPPWAPLSPRAMPAAPGAEQPPPQGPAVVLRMEPRPGGSGDGSGGAGSAWMFSRVPGCSPGISLSLGKGGSGPRASCPLPVPRC